MKLKLELSIKVGKGEKEEKRVPRKAESMCKGPEAQKLLRLENSSG